MVLITNTYNNLWKERRLDSVGLKRSACPTDAIVSLGHAVKTIYARCFCGICSLKASSVHVVFDSTVNQTIFDALQSFQNAIDTTS